MTSRGARLRPARLRLLGPVRSGNRHRGLATAGMVVLLTGGVWVCLLGAATAWRTAAVIERRDDWGWVAAAATILLPLCVAWAAHRRMRSAARVGQWSRRWQRNDGVASAWAIWRVAGRRSVRRRAGVLRPSVRGLGPLARLRVPTLDYATPLARTGLQRIWSPIEDVTLRVGGPRTGKSGELGCRILDAPGAVIATSTRTDLIDHTARVRSRLGPLYVFNPAGLGDRASTIRFDPLTGCGDAATAGARAEDLLAGASAPGQSGDREFWAAQARHTLGHLLHAAALGEAGMADVLAWVADPDEAAIDVRRFLRRSPEPGAERAAMQFLKLNERTRSSICATIMPALAWLQHPCARAAAAAGNGFDVEALLCGRGTVYLLGAQEATTAPLVTALTGHIAREARRIAAHAPLGRLDPPLTLVLDEAALICPVPLDAWTADMGGRNVTIHIAVQSRAQLRARWGDTGAAAIVNNAATLMVFGGTRDFDDLAGYATLTGERLEQVPTWDENGRLTATTTRRVPVLSAAQIAQLPERHVLIIRRGMPPAIGKVAMVWKRRDVRRADRRYHRAQGREHALARIEAPRARIARWCRDVVRPRLNEIADRAKEMRTRVRANYGGRR